MEGMTKIHLMVIYDNLNFKLHLEAKVSFESMIKIKTVLFCENRYSYI